MTIAVVGHVEWTEFAPVDRVPLAGEIIESEGAWQQPAGGGAVAAVRKAIAKGEGDTVTIELQERLDS